jgi:2'-5' RNA ligase
MNQTYEQLSLDGFDPPAPASPPPPPQGPQRPPRFMPRELLFFAIYLGRIAAAQSTQLAYELINMQAVGARPHRILHCTLLPFGDFTKIPEEIVEALLLAGARVTAPSFDMAWDHVMRFGPESAALGPLVLRAGAGETELRALQTAICSTIEAALPGIRMRWSFTPHVTLARTGFIQQRAIEPIRLGVREFSLVHSIQSRGWHEMLGSWRLQD